MVVVEKREKPYIFVPFKCRVAERILNPRHTTDLPTPFVRFQVVDDCLTEEVTTERTVHFHHYVNLYALSNNRTHLAHYPFITSF